MRFDSILNVLNTHFFYFSFPGHYQREMLLPTFVSQQLIPWCNEISVPRNTLQDLHIEQLALLVFIFQLQTQLQPEVQGAI